MNKFDEAIKTIQDGEYEINDIGGSLIKLTLDEASEIIDQLELGKLYKELFDLIYFEVKEEYNDSANWFDLYSSIHDENNQMAYSLYKKIKELENNE